MRLVRRHDPAQGRRRLLIDLEQRALDGREAGGRLAVVPRRLVDALEGREAVEDLAAAAASTRAVEDASTLVPSRTQARLQDVRRAPRTRGEPRRRDEQVEDAGPTRRLSCTSGADEQLPKGLELVGTQRPPADRR